MNSKKGFSIKDIIVVVCSIIALVILLFVLLFAKKNKEETNKLLTDIKEQEENVVFGNSAIGSLVFNEANAEGWIELYNLDSETADLTGDIIKLNGEQVYSFDKATKIKDSSVIVAEIGKNPGENEKNVLTLENANGEQITAWYIPALCDKQSYARKEDGGIETSIMSSTKGKSNVGGKSEEIKDLTFSVPSGFYAGTFYLELSAPKGYEIYYTVDGKAPTVNSKKYDTSIEIKNKSGSSYYYAAKGFGYKSTSGYHPTTVDMGTVVKAIMVDADGNIVSEKEAVYYVDLQGDPEYLNMPIVSITVDEKDLFDYFTGIYTPGRSKEDAVARGEKSADAANYLNGWLKDSTVEYFEAGKSYTYKGNGQLSIAKDKNVSTRQKSLNITLSSNDVKGNTLERYLDENGVLRLTTFGDDNSYRVREQIANFLVSENAVGTQKLHPCSVFINGEYWGCYLIKEGFDSRYFEENYGIKDLAISVADSDNYNDEFESFYRFVVMNDMSSEYNYNRFLKMADIDSLADYICVNMYLSNGSFKLRNGIAWKTEVSDTNECADGKWRWILGDMSDTMRNDKVSGAFTTATIDSFLTSGFSKEPFIQSLMNNENFKKALYDSMSKLIKSSFSDDNVSNVTTAVADYMHKAVVATDTRFYGNINDKGFNYVISTISEFLTERKSYISVYCKELLEFSGDIDVLNNARGISENSAPEEVEEIQTEDEGESLEDADEIDVDEEYDDEYDDEEDDDEDDELDEEEIEDEIEDEETNSESVSDNNAAETGEVPA